MILRIACILLVTFCFGCSRTSDQKTTLEHKAPVELVSEEVQLRWKNENIPIQKLLDSLNIKVSSLHIEIEKLNYRLGVYSDTILLKSYPVVFGSNPEDDKLKRGDSCTPEGEFKIRSKYPHAKWSKFIWIDYPNESSWKKHNDAKQKGLIAANADPGGEIGIHGVPEGADYAIDYRQNWTLGCISMKNKHVDEVYPIFHKDIIVEIRK
jgi:murein L,D-transpeptidase YafK